MKRYLALILTLSVVVGETFAHAGEPPMRGVADIPMPPPPGRILRSGEQGSELAENMPGMEVPVPAHSPANGEGLAYLPLPFWGPNGMETADEPHKVAAVLQILAVLTLITLAPSLLIMLTCFTRVLIVMGFVRRALATNTLPPDQIMVGLSLFLTFYIMYPTWQATWNDGLRPYFNGEEVEVVQGEGRRRMSQPEALERTLAPTRAFMFACLEQNEAHDELYFFMGLANRRIPPGAEGTLTRADIPTHVLIPAFMTAELRRAFWMGFLLYLPFLILDMTISSILMSMGMMMLPPVMISLPFKIILFVMVDGWRLLMEGIVTSFPEAVLSTMIVEPPAVVPAEPVYPVG